jgi:hypothetical protein
MGMPHPLASPNYYIAETYRSGVCFALPCLKFLVPIQAFNIIVLPLKFFLEPHFQNSNLKSLEK